MDENITSFDALYRKYYKDDIENDKERERLVGELMMPALQNDDEAIGNIISLMIDPSFAVVRNVLFQWGERFRSLELMQDLMQEVTELMKRIFFRGIPESVKEEELLKYLLGAVQKNTFQKLSKNFEKEIKSLSDDGDIEKEKDAHINQRVKKLKSSVPQEAEPGEGEKEQDFKSKMIDYFMECFMNTEIEPHKAVTYGYATLLPMMFKSTQNEQVLQEMDAMSGRRYSKKTSSYKWNSRKERFELTGEIARASSVLMKWAIDAMWEMTVDFLQKEIQETYNMEPIGNAAFEWGQAFKANLLKDYDEKRKEKDIVITSEFSELNMKNWPVRLAASLYKKTREHFMEEEYYETVASDYGATI